MAMAAHDGDTRPDSAFEAAFEVDVALSGHPQVDVVLDRLSDLAGRPLSGHAEIYDDVHQRLRGILAEPGAGAGSAQSSGEQR